MKIVFLDIDGVLNCKSRHPTTGTYLHWIDPVAVKLLNRITDATGAKIVVSSSWRIGRHVEFLADELRSAGVTGTIVGRTGVLKAARRREIAEWLESHCDVENYVVLDDSDDASMPHFVQTTWEYGLEEHHVTQAIEYLNAPRLLICDRNAGIV